MAILRSRPSSKEDDEGRQTGLYRRSAIIRRISEAVDLQLRQEQAGFRKGCTDQIFTLRNIIEQCTEWQRQLYINYVHFEKTFDSIHRECLWRILKSYGIPKQIILVIKSFFNNFKCRVGNSESSFDVKTGVRQGCPMSALLFNLTIDWVMQQTTTDRVRGIRWTLLSTLEDLDFADDVELFSHPSAHARENHPSRYVCTTSRPEGQPEEDRSDDPKCLEPLTNQSEWRRPSDNRRTHLPWQHCKARWRSRQRHQESPQQGQEYNHPSTAPRPS